jgi:hypothetical protein
MDQIRKGPHTKTVRGPKLIYTQTMKQKGTITNNGNSITITLEDGTQITIPYTGTDLPDGTQVTAISQPAGPSPESHPQE